MVKNSALVSVIIPTYNRSKTVIRSINSILCQTYSNIELIIVDDGSDDNTYELVSAVQDERIMYIRNIKNVGVAQARNIGVKFSKGDYIAFNDSDDVWKQDKLEKQLKFLCNNQNYHLCYCSYVLHKEDKLIEFPNKSIEKYKMSGNIYEYLLERNWIGTPTIVISRKAFLDVCGFNKKLRALDDWEIVIKVSRLYQIKFLDDVLVDAYYSSNGITAGFDNYFNNAKALIEIIKENKKWNKNTERLKKMYDLLINYLVYLSDTRLDVCKKLAVPFLFSEVFIFDRIINNQKQLARYEEKYRVLSELNNSSMSIKKIDNFIADKNIKKIAIYGYGDNGKILINYLLNIGVEIDYIVDKNKDLYSNYTIFTPEENLPDSDIMLISIIDNSYKTSELMQKKLSCEVVRLQDII